MEIFILVSQKIKTWFIILPHSFLSCSFPWRNLEHTLVKGRQTETTSHTTDTPASQGFYLPPTSSVLPQNSLRHPIILRINQFPPQNPFHIAQTWTHGSLFSKLLPISMSNVAFAKILIPVNLSLLHPCSTLFSFQCHMWLRILAQPPSPWRSQVLQAKETAAERWGRAEKQWIPHTGEVDRALLSSLFAFGCVSCPSCSSSVKVKAGLFPSCLVRQADSQVGQRGGWLQTKKQIKIWSHCNWVAQSQRLWEMSDSFVLQLMFKNRFLPLLC